MRIKIPKWEGTIFRAKGASPGHTVTCSVVNILKVTQQGAAPVQCGYHHHHFMAIIQDNLC